MRRYLRAPLHTEVVEGGGTVAGAGVLVDGEMTFWASGRDACCVFTTAEHAYILCQPTDKRKLPVGWLELSAGDYTKAFLAAKGRLPLAWEI